MKNTERGPILLQTNQGYNTYQRCKNSNIEWLGKIPAHWDTVKLKYVCSTVAEYGENIPSDDYTKNGIRFLRTTDINEKGEILDDDPVYVSEDALEAGQFLQDGDVLFSRSGSIGQSYLHKDDKSPKLSFAGYLVRFHPKEKLNPKFLFYFSKAKNFELWLKIQLIESTISNVNGNKYANLQISLPPVSEQMAIVNFLDRETSKIDRLIDKQEKLIDLLEEKRIALISNTVTKGLDETVEMKVSGVDWLGKIPKHWETRLLKFLLSQPIKDGPHTSPDFVQNGYPFLSVDGIQDGKLVFENSRYVSEEDFKTFREKATPQKNDILMGKAASTGKIAIVDTDKEFSIWSPLALLRLNQNHIMPKFAEYALKSEPLQIQVDFHCAVNTQKNIGMGDIPKLVLPLPKYEEQKAIVKFLDRETSKIDRLIEKVKKGIDTLNEYGTALISAAVTGKIDVRGEV